MFGSMLRRINLNSFKNNCKLLILLMISLFLSCHMSSLPKYTPFLNLVKVEQIEKKVLFFTKTNIYHFDELFKCSI